MFRRPAVFLLSILLFGTLLAQPDGKVRRPYSFSLTTNPALPVVGHLGAAIDYRMFPRHAIGLEYTAMTRALHEELSTDSLPDFFDSWLPANGHRFFLRYKVYPFFNRQKVRLSYFYISAQFMYRQIEFSEVEISYFELTKTYSKVVRETRSAGRLDLTIGTDIPLGDYFIVGGYVGTGLGTEHVSQFNTMEYDLQGVIGPERQFFEGEPDFFKTLLGFRTGIVLGVTLPDWRR